MKQLKILHHNETAENISHLTESTSQFNTEFPKMSQAKKRKVVAGKSENKQMSLTTYYTPKGII